MFGELQIVPCGCVRGCGRRGGRQGGLGQSLDLSLPLPLRCLVDTCPPGFWPLLEPGDAKKSARRVCGQIQALLYGPLKTMLNAGLESFILEQNWEPLKSYKQGGHRYCASWGSRRMLSLGGPSIKAAEVIP